MSVSTPILDLTRDLRTLTTHAAPMQDVDQLIGETLEALGRLVPYDLATVMEIEGDELKVRVARGPLDGPSVRRHRLQLKQFPQLRDVLRTRRARTFLADDHQHGDALDGVLDLPPGHACMVTPLCGKGESLGIMTFDRARCEAYPPAVVELADVIGKLLAMAIVYGEQSSLLARLRSQLEEQNRVLSERVAGRNEATLLMEASHSDIMRHIVRLAKQVAATDTPVLITGETGTGKEVLANAIHAWSPRAGQPLVSINCAALPASLIESELFGHVKGAFTGAVNSRVGRFQAANGGTLFLDEVGELPLDLQAKLLRVLQEGCFEPVGSDRTVRVDVRIVAATNRDLLAACATKQFREDVYYRLAVFPMHLPPLRARIDDVPSIAANFLSTLHRRTGRGPWRLSSAALAVLRGREWRGNVRELVNFLERATILSHGPDLDLSLDAVGPATGGLPMPEVPRMSAASMPAPAAAGHTTLASASGTFAGTVPAGPRAEHAANRAERTEGVTNRAVAPADTNDRGPVTLEQLERQHIERTLTLTRGKIYGPGGAAQILGINANTLRGRMRKLGIVGARTFRQNFGGVTAEPDIPPSGHTPT